ncbi:virion structural protein [Burkholderia phage BcepMigl]|uniref:Virion associated protein n=1 Tax=Burkholderia phage BcepMigl TaxID=2886899 RepID=I6XGE8_9CAUD|nr:virion structural protein [Burkholderia phage BcepMigl]AFN39121.1 virion associated protein [Burkholderia phage BcepMigl]
MTILQSLWATGQRMTPTADCYGDEVAQLFEFSLPATALAANDIIELAILPANHAPSDAILVADDLDSGGAPAIVFDVGVMSGDVGDKVSARTCGNELFSASNVGQAGGTARATLASAFTIAPSDKDRSIGVKITTAAQAQVANAKLRLLLKYRPV